MLPHSVEYPEQLVDLEIESATPEELQPPPSKCQNCGTSAWPSKLKSTMQSIPTALAWVASAWNDPYRLWMSPVVELHEKTSVGNAPTVP